MCNGQIVNGYTTPTLNVNKFIKITNDSNLNGTMEGNDTANVVYTSSTGSSTTHNHYPGGDDHRAYDTTYSAYHQSDDWIHYHNSFKNIAYRHPYFTMNFIIYLG